MFNHIALRRKMFLKTWYMKEQECVYVLLLTIVVGWYYLILADQDITPYEYLLLIMYLRY